MPKCAKAGGCLPELIRMAIPWLQEAERQCPRTGRGAKPKIPDWFIGLLIMTAVLKRKKSKLSQFRFLSDPANRRMITELTGCQQFPSRSTFFRRYRRAHRLFRMAIRLQGQQAIQEGLCNPQVVAVDKSLIAARGPLWHKKDRRAGRIPPGLHGVDQESTWGYSEYDGWVQGYSVELLVTATQGSTVFPLAASADTASAKETQTCQEKLADLPQQVRYVVLDSGYDSNQLAEQVEYDGDQRPTGRRFLCPENPRNSKPNPAAQPPPARDRHQRRRLRRRKFFHSPKGQRIYARRRQSVEPFLDWFKGLFELDHHVWHRGLDNNRSQLLAAVFAYQLLVRYNYRLGNLNGQVKWIMDSL